MRERFMSGQTIVPIVRACMFIVRAVPAVPALPETLRFRRFPNSQTKNHL
jgi:hypothetical protein